MAKAMANPHIDLIRSDKSIETFEYHDRGDARGRFFFTLHWWMENFHLGPSWRGQCFKTNPKPMIDARRKQGFSVREIDPCGNVTLLPPINPCACCGEAVTNQDGSPSQKRFCCGQCATAWREEADNA